MKRALIVAMVLMSVAPSWAASKLKKYEKILVCGLYAGGEAKLQAGPSGTVPVNLDNAYDLIRKELATRLQDAGVTLVPFDEANAAVKKQRAAGVAEGRGKVAPAAAAMGRAGGEGVDAAGNAAMMNALKDPRLTPEMREQIKKSVAGSPSSGGMMQDMMASKMSGLIDQGEAAGAMRRELRGDDSADGLAGLCPPPNMDEVVKDRENARFFALLESLGADAWLNVGAGLKEPEALALASVSRMVRTPDRFWVYSATLFDGSGKRVWNLKKPVEGELIKLAGKTAGPATKAIEAAVPDSVSKFVEKLTD